MMVPTRIHGMTLAFVLAILTLGVYAWAQPGANEPANAICPVLTDQKVNSEIHADHNGKRVYFCCAKCRRQFLENPDKYLDKPPQFAAASNHPQAGAGFLAPAPIPVAAEPTPQAPQGPSEGAGSIHVHDESEEESQAHDSEQGAEGHSHATGHERPQGARRFVAYLGKLHPMVVHFPIAFVVAAALAEALYLGKRKTFYADAARFCIALGGVAALVTAGFGWAAGAFAHYAGELVPVLWWHRWTGTATAVLALGAVLMSEFAWRKPQPAYRVAYRLLLLGAFIAIAFAGHLGATLIYGFGHLSW